MKTKALIFCMLILLIGACKKQDKTDSPEGYLMFGHFYGFCRGPQCIEIYKLEKNQLLEDTTDQYPGRTNFYEGKYIQQSQDKFNLAKDLIDYFPQDLLSEPDTVIGLPDGGDWGGLYVEYNYNGIRKFWLLDQMQSHVPVKYHAFIDKINEKISLIQ